MERRGTLVTREEIAAYLWPSPEMVDTGQAINNAITRIRGLLNDDPQRPRYIETAVGRGYRFIGTVDEIADPEESPAVEFAEPSTMAKAEPPADATTARAPVPPPVFPVTVLPARWFGIAALSLLLAAGLWFFRRMTPSVPLPLKPTQITTNESDNRVTTGAISSDGKLLAYADPDGLFLRVVKTGATQPLKLPAALRVDHIAWFPDDLRLLLSGFNTQALRFQVWTASIESDSPYLIREDARNAMPSPDASRLAFTSIDESRIWTSGASGENPRLFLKGRPGEHFPFLFWANDGKRLSYQSRQYAPGRNFHVDYLWRYESRDTASGKELASVENIRFDSACVTGDGRMIYLDTDPPKYGPLRGIWEVQTDRATGAFLSAPRQLASLNTDVAYGITASSSGKQVAAVWERGQSDVYIGDLLQPGPALANVRRLTSDSRNDFAHAWTPDSQSVIFESDREGNFHLFRQRLDRHVAQRLTEMQGQQVYPQVAPDGNTVLFSSLSGRRPSSSDSLYRVSLDGGAPAEVPLDRPLDEFRCPVSGSGSCVLRETLEHRQYAFYELDPVKGKGRELARTS